MASSINGGMPLTMEHAIVSNFDIMSQPSVTEMSNLDLDLDKPRNEDVAVLANLGVKQEMKRTFNMWSLGIMYFSASVTWEAITTTLAQSLTAGGSSSLVWGFVVAACGGLLIALSLSEYASMMPTAGGRYHYVAYMSPPRFKRILSWYAGWMALWAWILSSAAGIFATAMQLQSYVILFRPEYDYQRWHTSLLLIGMATFFAFVSIFGVKWIHYGTSIAITTHIVGYFATVIYLLVKVEHKNSAKFVFTDTTNLTSWDNKGVAWSIGLLTSALGFVGWDCSTHMAEEMKHASRDLPKTMWGTVAISGVLTWPWVIALMFCTTNISELVAGPVGLMSPFVQMMYNVSGRNQAATIGITIFFIIIGFVTAGATVLSAASRVLMLLAREGAFPSIFAQIHPRLKVPVNAIILV